VKVRFVTNTQGTPLTEFEGKSIDEIIVGIARVSSSREVNELFTEPHKLLRHCLSHGHWSIFDEANITIEIATSRAMGRELLRHDWKKQEFSQRYSEVVSYEPVELRKQAQSNRQSSSEIIDDVDLNEKVRIHLNKTKLLYDELIENDVARECARMIQPECATTVLYLNGTIRVILSFLNQRLHNTAQKEIREVAELIRDQFKIMCPVISKMMFDFEDADKCHIFERIILEKYGVYDMVKSNDFKKIKKK
jgi:thymidylate synthase (FAD)